MVIHYKKSLATTIVLLSLISLASQSKAIGALFSRPRGSNVQHEKMWIKSVDVKTEIEQQIAVTHVDQIFVNQLNTSVEAIYIFPLPENAMITELYYWVGDKRFRAEIKEREEAVKQYNEKLRRWLDPALLEYLGDNLFRLSIVPIPANAEVRTEMTYVEPLLYDLGIVTYLFQLNTLELSPQPLERVSVQVDATSNSAFKHFSSPSHDVSTGTQIVQISDKHYRLVFGDENFFPERDLVIQFETLRQNVDLNVLTYTPTEEDGFGENSFYVLWITPPDSVPDEEVIPKDIVFTVDLSSSMEGERLQQIKQAMEYFIDLLNPADRFNIITFGTVVTRFKPDLVAAEPVNIEAAHDFVFQMYALGLTNIEAALLESLGQAFANRNSSNIVFLTDGMPTWGQTNPDIIRNAVRDKNTADVRIFSFGIGDEVSRPLLASVSAENHGYAQFIASDDSIALIVNDHFKRISKPVLQNISLDLGGLQTWDQYPKNISDLFWGSQLMYLGLYNNGGTYDITLSGELRDQPFLYSQPVGFPKTPGGHRFVPRLWAQEKIDDILELISIHGESNELVDQIVDLSLRFQILTPYTAFYVDPDEQEPEDPDATAVESEPNGLPASFALHQNYPNPFNPSTEIRYELPAGRASYQVTIKVYDTLGRLIAILVSGEKAPGRHKVIWNGLDLRGNPVPSGIYFYTIQADDFARTKKMALVR